MQIHSLAFFSNILGMDGLVVLVIGLLIFGRRLPEVGKNIGQTIVEFKKGLNGKGLEGEAEEQEAAKQVPVNRNLEARQPRVAAGSTPRTKSLPSTEEV